MPYSNPKQQKAAQHRWYLRNKKRLLVKGRKDKDDKRNYVAKQKSKPCQDCDIQFPWYVMDFDHRDGESKLAKVSYIVNSFGWKKLKEEIAKCDIVCANCHRIRTYKKNNIRGRPDSTELAL